MSRSYPVITLWLLENPFDIITLWQLQEGKCSISSPTSTLFWEPGASLFSTSWSAKCLWGSVWGAFLISALETCQGLRVSNQSRGYRRVAVRGRAMGLWLPVHGVENYSSTRGEYLVLSKRPVEHFPQFCLTLHFHLQALGVHHIRLRSAFSFACVRQGLFSTDSFM